MTKVRGGIRPQSRSRRSDAWQAPKPTENVAASINGDAAAALFAGEQPPPPDPAVIGMVDPEVNVDETFPPAAFQSIYVEVDPAMPVDRIELRDAQANRVVGAIDGIGFDPRPGIGTIPGNVLGDRVTSKPAALQLAKVGPLEVDQLWDWVRADRDGVFNFLGFIPDHSLHLYKWIDNFQGFEREGRARFHSIHVAGSLIGFLMLYPIQQNGAQSVADCHLYLSQAARGNVRALLPQLLAELDRSVPTLALRVVTARDDEWARLLRGVGFAAQIVLTRPAAVLTGNASGS